MKLRNGLLIALSTTIFACTSAEQMEWISVGGSKAGGTVVLGIDVPPKMGISETIVKWDPEQPNREANKRCQSWGYAGAEAFGEKLPVQVTCHPQGISPCWSKTMRINYQLNIFSADIPPLQGGDAGSVTN